MQTRKERHEIRKQILDSPKLSKLEKTRAIYDMLLFAYNMDRREKANNRLIKHGQRINALIEVNNLRVDLAKL